MAVTAALLHGIAGWLALRGILKMTDLVGAFPAVVKTFRGIQVID